jgi:ATP-dependent RNA helicase DeaD
LLHLANKIKDVEVDHEIDNYLPAINNVLENLSKEELIKKMVSVEFNRFINYYKKLETFQINLQVLKDVTTETVLKRIIMVVQQDFVNIGSRDNFDWMSLKDYS